MKSGNDDPRKSDGSLNNLDRRLNQTLKSVQGLLKVPGKILLSRKGAEPAAPSVSSPAVSPYRKDVDEEAGISPNVSGAASASTIKADASRSNGSDTSEGVAENERPSSSPFGHSSSSKGSSTDTSRPSTGGRATDSARVARFKKELASPAVNLDALRELAWSGVPPDMRPIVWRLLVGYAPPNADRREVVLERKRQEYIDCIPQYYDISDADRTEDERTMLRQISVDAPRTVPDVTFFQHPEMQTSLIRVLYIWAIRHPASGYVQGINDLATPFIVVFLSEYLEGDMENWDITKLTPEIVNNYEADCYWCLSKLLDGVQDHYTFAQPGIQRLVFKLKELVRRIDEPVSTHIEEQGLEFLQFAFRWFNCLLIREIPFPLVGRLWDTYLSEGDAFPEYLVYVCASFLLTWSDQLQQLDFQEMVLFIQHLPTKNWTHQELEMVLSRAFMWRVMFQQAPSHLSSG
ncbi:TBC1 domain family member 2 [Marchantia polymorpha subsp. ruderalis]|uniref:Rab-GAP TBC domain-containing protein n=2 Tax=Marchantia polymorpha TaxID=3197 RepID=A0AAF6C018_MARPO|nr:hypothetical protein MARPO_0111s0053 [Marchantia polymorpha]BBN17602.1 hypothetical protein Mp_7g15660 [Marchantia polymorpha subsp. ruderalis]|eukprot:PTQ31500.1 hypothetical protein MARPO_0111s0053 [Marchantia polymorpha]